MVENFYINDQLKRIDRKTELLKDSNDINDSNFHTYRDAFIDFCIQCYQLKDVLIQASAFNRNAVEDYINYSQNLSICANVANKAKHLKLTKEREPKHRRIFNYW